MLKPYVAQFSQHAINSTIQCAADRFDWDAPIESWSWMNGAALAEHVELPVSKSTVTALGIWYRAQPKAVCKRTATVRLMLIPPMRDTR